MNTSICHVCGKAFQTAGRYAKFCPECRVQQDEEIRVEHNRARREKKRAATREERPVSLAETNRAAKAAGMTYGQWVATHGG